MANDLSTLLKEQLYGQVSDDPFLALFTLNHPSFAAPFRLVNNSEDIISRGETFQFYPVSVVLPDDNTESARQVRLRLDNIDLTIISELRKVTTPISVKLEMVLASDPDTVQYSLDELSLRNISYDLNYINATLALDDFLSVGLTSERYTATRYPGIF